MMTVEKQWQIAHYTYLQMTWHSITMTDCVFYSQMTVKDCIWLSFTDDSWITATDYTFHSLIHRLQLSDTGHIILHVN
jgi:hypothetical protein